MSASGNGSMDGVLMLNNGTGEYAISIYTDGAPALVSGHLSDLNGGETVIRDLAQRPSNPTQFFGYGTFSMAEVDALRAGNYSLDVHQGDGSTVLSGSLQ